MIPRKSPLNSSLFFSTHPNPPSGDLHPWISKLISTIFLLSPPTEASSRLNPFRVSLLDPPVAAAAVRRLSASGFSSAATALVDLILSDGSEVGADLLGELLLSFSGSGDLPGGTHVLRQALSLSCRLPAAPFNSLMNSLTAKDRHRDAILLFREHLALQSFVPDSCSFNIAMKCLVKLGEVEEAVELFNSMENFDCEPDSFSHNILVHGLCRSNQLERAREILRSASSSEFFVAYTSIISELCKARRMKEACEVFDEMRQRGIKPSGITFNVLIDGFGKMGDTAAAGGVYREMVAAGNLPDVVTFTSLVDGHCRAGEVEAAMGRWREMAEKEILPNCYTFAVMLNGLCKMNRLGEAREVVEELRKRRDLRPRAFVFNPAVDGFCKAGRLWEAEEIVEEMEARGCTPDKVTYTILIIGNCVKGRIGRAMALFSKMVEEGCRPDEVTVGSLVSCLMKAGMPREAQRVMVSSRHEGEDYASG